MMASKQERISLLQLKLVGCWLVECSAACNNPLLLQMLVMIH